MQVPLSDGAVCDVILDTSGSMASWSLITVVVVIVAFVCSALLPWQQDDILIQKRVVW